MDADQVKGRVKSLKIDGARAAAEIVSVEDGNFCSDSFADGRSM